MALQYAPLHVHTDASLDGLGTVEALVENAHNKGFESLAMTDHGTLANAINFWSQCRAWGIKPILGLEGYIVYSGSPSKRNHITLLAKTQDGFNNLIGLNNAAHAQHDGHRPVFTLGTLDKYHKGLHVLTGCHASPLHDCEYEQGMQFVGVLKDIMGPGNLHAEVMFISSFDDYKRSLEAAERFDIPFAITNDTHFCGKGHHEHQQELYKSRVPGIGGYNSMDCFLKTRQEMMDTGKRWVDEMTVDEGLEQTLRIADQVEEWDMRAEPSLPTTPEALDELTWKLKNACLEDIRENGDSHVRIERLRKEFNTFRERGLIDYVFVLEDIIRHARDEGIYVGPGRGSGGGSYALYLLGITSVDPIRYGLMFERFLNSAREDYPDVDVDFESDRRSEVIAYAAERWGAVPIATYSRYSHKSAIHDIARRLRISKEWETPAIDSEYGSPAWDDFCEKDRRGLADELYNLMIGQIRHKGRHAGGVVITDKPIPMEKLGKGKEIVAAWTEGNNKELSKAGVVKYDLLGLTALSQLKSMVELSSAPLPIMFDDPAVFRVFAEGSTTGIFQWSGSEGIRELTMAVNPKTFMDLVAINSLYRPGALDAGTARKYPHYMKHPRRLHDRLDPILEETYGVICFQEQVMAVFAEVTGMGLEHADLARRVIVKSKMGDPKWEADVAMLQETFITEGKKQGFDRVLLDTTWRELYTHSRYSFNKAHSTAYAMIAYQMAWYKVYHFEAFIAAMMNYDVVNAQTYLIEAIRAGLTIKPPDINISSKKTVVAGKTVYLPLNDVSFFGDKGIDLFLAERAKGEFVTYAEFNERVAKRTCNNRVRINLERLGAFDNLTGDPRDAINKYDDIAFIDPVGTQLEILGYIIPTLKIIGTIDRMKARPTKPGVKRFAGIVVKVQERVSKAGPYEVYTLSPEGAFWVRVAEKRMPMLGDLVTGTKNSFGQGSNLEYEEVR